MNKIKSIYCVLIGHSRIIDTCFGYIYCGRCEDQIGDSLGGVFDTSKSVVIDHNCKQCTKNYKHMTFFKDKFLTKNPFPKKAKKK